MPSREPDRRRAGEAAADRFGGGQRRDHAVPGPPQPARSDRLRDSRGSAKRVDEPAECRLDLDLDDEPGRCDSAEARAGAGVEPDDRENVDRRRPAHGPAESTKTPWPPTIRPARCCPSGRCTRVLLVTQGNLFLQKALEVNPLVELTTTKQLPANYAGGVVHVFHRLVPEKLPPGNSLVVDPRAVATSGRSAGDSKIRSSRSRTPIRHSCSTCDWITSCFPRPGS